MPKLLEQLQSGLGAAYLLERELGGGGMSRVFLAEEVALGRKVVIKVLPPEMGAGVNLDRFRREIHLAARLQHPHIVSIHAAGSAGDLLWYSMPYIEGESLRARLVREGELPVNETVQILREVTDALASAHEKGVVHRDIKPDNVMLSGGHALVTDFGIAKAVTVSGSGQTITSLGAVIGTPAYMAPEQAAGDPNVDHRADLYAVGAMAYEMLAGQPPFVGHNAQVVLAAHVTQTPTPVSSYRPTVPAPLNAIVMRCLEKRAADRWQRAADLLPHFDALLTTLSGIAPAGAAAPISSGHRAASGHAHPVRLVLLFALTSLGVLALVYALIHLLALPDWVLVGAAWLLLIGLPIILVTGRHERQRAVFHTSRAGPREIVADWALGRFFTWRRAIGGGLAAFSALGVGTALFMAMRVFGIGPVGTLVASGKLKDRERILIADFKNGTTDSLLGDAVTQAFRVDFSQSKVVSPVPADYVQQVLARMGKMNVVRLDFSLAREVAEREGLKGVITGEIAPAGGRFILSAQLTNPASGEVLTGFRETADDSSQIVPAVDRISKRLRAKIGESLRSIRSNAPLAQVTTSSLEALRKYSQALRVGDQGDDARAVRLLEDAVALDTGFAMAYRKLGVLLNNQFIEHDRMRAALTKAFERRGRLTDRERYLTEGTYYSTALGDEAKAIAAYQSLLDLYPDDSFTLVNLGVSFESQGDYPRAVEMFRRNLVLQPSEANTWGNLFAALLEVGRPDSAAHVAQGMRARLGDHPAALSIMIDLALANRHYDDAMDAANEQIQKNGQSLQWKSQAEAILFSVATIRGKLGEADRYRREQYALDEQRELNANRLNQLIRGAEVTLFVRRRPEDAARMADAALRTMPIQQLPAADRPYLRLAALELRLGRADRARRYVAEFEQARPAPLARAERVDLGAMKALLAAWGDKKPAEALTELPAELRLYCVHCWLHHRAEFFDAAGQRDSALAAYEAYSRNLDPSSWVSDRLWLHSVYIRMGELYEEKGDRAKAVESYGKFTDLWKNADPELQPRVAEAKRRIAALTGEPR